MKKISVVSKEDGMKIAKEFQGACSIESFFTENNRWLGSERSYIGAKHEVPDNVIALWVERRQDIFGYYAKFRCVIDRS